MVVSHLGSVQQRMLAPRGLRSDYYALMGIVIPTVDELMERAARHLMRAAKEPDPIQAMHHRHAADVLAKEAEDMTNKRGQDPNLAEPDPSLDEPERHVREGEQRVARQIILVNQLDRAGRHDDAREARELLGVLTDTLYAAKRQLQIVQRT